MRGFFSFLLDSLIRPRCAICAAPTGPVPGREGVRIPDGWPPETIAFLEACPPGPGGRGPGAEVLCASCWMKLAPLRDPGNAASSPGCARVIAPFRENGTLVSLVRFLKFEGGRRAAWPLAWWMARSLEREMGLPPRAALVPVPLHGARLASRGYNQAELLAEGVSSLTGIPVIRGRVRRARRTRAQSKLDRARRAANVHGAFELRRAGGLGGLTAIVVDDLVTSGATAAACAGALLGAHPARIVVLAAGTALACGKIPLKVRASCV